MESLHALRRRLFSDVPPSALTALMQAGLAVAAVAVVLDPSTAHAAFPIPYWDALVTDVQDLGTNQGGLIGTGMGIMVGAAKLILSSGEYGFANFVRAGAGGGVFGASPDLASYFVAG